MRNVLKTLALAVAGALSLSAAALADEVRVPYGDLDLTRPAGAATLDARIKGAATDHCAANRNQYDKSRTSPSTCRSAVVRELRSAIPAAERRELQIAKARPAAVEVAGR